MDPTVAFSLFILILLTAAGAWLIPKPPPPRRPNHILEIYDRK